MKNFNPKVLFAVLLLMTSCNDDDSDSSAPISENEGLFALINGSTFPQYQFSDSVYQANFETSNNTLTINAADINGQQITLFLNGTGGFSNSTIKEMGDVDTNNFRTYILIRQSDPQLSFYSSSGSITITENRTHPTESNQRLISGMFNIDASTTDSIHTVSMNGSFTDLSYEN